MRPKNEDLELLGRCSAEVRKTCPAAEVILFGSRACGVASPDSDMDLLILLPEASDVPVCEEAIHRQLYVLSVEADVAITALVYARTAWNDPVRRSGSFHKAVSAQGIQA